MEFRLETVYLGAKRFLYDKKSKITIENKTIRIPIPVKNDEMTVLKFPSHLGTDYRTLIFVFKNADPYLERIKISDK